MSESLEAVEADATTTAEGAIVPLVTEAGEELITVPPPGKWKGRANTMLRVGDFEGWAEITLSGADYDKWVELDPTNDEIEAFFEAWKEESGESISKSRASRRSSGSTRRR